MDSLRTKYEGWRLRRGRSPFGTPKSVKGTITTQCTSVPSSLISSQTPTAEDAGHASLPSDRSSSRAASRLEVQENNDASAELWRQAFEIVSKTEDWKECCRIVHRKTGAQMDQPDSQANPLQQVVQIMAQVKQLVGNKAQASDNKFQAFLDGTIKTLQVVKDLGAAAVAFNPYAAVGWNVVQFIVSVSTADRAVQKEACESLPKVLERVSRYQTFVAVYTEAEAIQTLQPHCNDSLLGVYTAILTYQVNVVFCLHSRMTRVKHSFTGEASSRLRLALDDLSLKEEQWRQLEPAVNREITDYHFKEVDKSIEQLKKASATILDEVKVVSSIVNSQRRAQVLDWISPLRYADAHKEAKRQPRPQTTDWLMNHRDYISWNDDGASKCLWLEGTPGSGKSCLVHAVIDDQLARCETKKEEAQVLYVYLDGTDRERKAQIDHHEKILRCLVKQLAASSSDTLPTTILDIYEHQHHRSCLTEDQCLNLLQSLSDSSINLTIIIDGLDECTPTVQGSLVRSLYHLIAYRDQGVRFLVACRYTVALENVLQGLGPRTINVPDHTEAAIRIMAECIVNESLHDPRLRFLYFIGTRALAPTVIDEVIKKAAGMFRFVQIALDRLNRSRNAHLLEKRLEELSRLRELESLYDIEWAEAMEDQNEMERKLIITALNFLIYGFVYGVREKLTDRWPTRNHQHILEVCTFLLKGKLDEAFSIDELVAMCPSFLTTSTRVAPGDGDSQNRSEINLRISHFSVTEYLVNRHPESFGSVAAHAAIAKLCMRMFVDLDIQTTFEMHPPDALALYATICWPEHLRLSLSLPAPSTKSQLMDPTLRDFILDSPCSASFQRWTILVRQFRRNIFLRNRGPIFSEEDDVDIFGTTPKENEVLEEALLTGVTLVTQPPSSLFARLYLGLETQALHDHDWNVRTTWEYKGTTVTPQTFAASMGLLSAIDILKAKGCSPNERNDQGETSGHVLCADGVVSHRRAEVPLPTVLRALIRAGLRLEVKNHAGFSCFNSLLWSPHFDPETFEVFQEQGFDFDAREPDYGSSVKGVLKPSQTSPIEFAVASMPISTGRGQRKDSLNVFLSYYTKRCSDVASRTKWLCLAVEYWNINSAKLLIEKYDADPTLFDEEDLLPIQHALVRCSNGSVNCGDVVDLLAPVTLKPGFHLRRPVGFNQRSTYEALLHRCTLQTIQLFVEYVAPIRPGPVAWGTRPITNALLFNTPHGRQIAEYLGALGCVNDGNSRVYRKWQQGKYHLYTDDHIEWNMMILGSKALDQDDIGGEAEESEEQEEEFWTRSRADRFVKIIDWKGILKEPEYALICGDRDHLHQNEC